MDGIHLVTRRVGAGLLVAVALLLSGIDARAQDATTVQVSVKNHRFVPAEIHGPANKPFRLTVRNLDAAAMEFESVSLRVEKLVAANSEGAINIRPLAPGSYEFFDDFHQETRGTLLVR
jgi:Cupredoxin-like domain